MKFMARFHGYFRRFCLVAFFDHSSIRNHYSFQIKNVDQLSVVFGNHQGFQKVVIFNTIHKSVTAKHQNNCLAQVQMKVINSHFRQRQNATFHC